MSRIISAADLEKCCAAILAGAGSSEAESRQVAANLVMANLSGHDSHGVGMTPRYVEAAAEGGLAPNTSAEILLDGGTLLSIDGRRGYGQIVGAQAMELGIARAKAHGSCIMTLANAHHLGRIGHFAEMATDRGLVSMHFVNVVARPVVAPWGGGDGRFGTNPCCIGVPLANDAPFILDFATSRVAQGKMRVAHNKGEKIPAGYLIDETGAPTDDPVVVVKPRNGLFGALMTFGEHKGYGLAIACELLGGALSGGPTMRTPPSTVRSIINGMLTVLIDPEKLGTKASFEEETKAFIAWLRQSPPGAGFDGVQIAGEPERRAREARARDGVEVDDETWGQIVSAGAKVGVAVSL